MGSEQFGNLVALPFMAWALSISPEVFAEDVSSAKPSPMLHPCPLPHPSPLPISGLQVDFAVLGFQTGMGHQCTLPDVSGQAVSPISLVGLCETCNVCPKPAYPHGGGRHCLYIQPSLLQSFLFEQMLTNCPMVSHAF